MRGLLFSVRAALACIVALLGRGAFAGEQLSTAALVRESQAILLVDNLLDGTPAVTFWLSGQELKATPLDVLAPPCVPDRKTLQQWLETHRTHPGRDVWQRVLAAGRTEQVVFLALRDGKLRPRCETEVMLGRSLASHPDYAAFRVELDALIPGAPSRARPPAPEATSPAPRAPSPAPSSSSSGCL